MKKATIILLLLFSGLGTIGQDLDKTFYLLGSLEDYCGRNYPKNNPLQWGYITTLHQGRIGEIKRIQEITGAKFTKPVKIKTRGKAHAFYNLKSLSWAKKINSFYDFTKNKKIRDRFGFPHYNGQLRCDEILNATRNQQLSFLAGQFLTAGEKTEKEYNFTLYNSPDRYNCLIKLLKKLECEVIREEMVFGYPVDYFIDFIPTNEIQKILDNEILKKEEIIER